jgi:coproporphyrinogen III oxidase-like Fe-S oxidoreductase
MTDDRLEKRNFLLFLNSTHAPKMEDSLIGALARPSSWDEVAGMIIEARRNDAFVRSINKLQIYIHLPFCGRICTFCGCNKVLLRRRSDIDEYIGALKEQLLLQAPVYEGMEAASVSMGGGTPSLLSEEQLADLLDGVDAAFPGGGDRKILIEISPSSWSPSKLALLRERGLFRLSMGIQSTDENVLKTVSRPQSFQKVLWCLRSAKKAGVPNINVDLIAGLPEQTFEGLMEDVQLVIDEGADIIHVQALTGTTVQELCGPGETIPEFYRRRDRMMKEAIHLMKENGFRYKRPDGYFRREEGVDYLEEAYVYNDAAVAAFGQFAIGQFPGAVHYRTFPAPGAMSEFPAYKATAQDSAYAMSHYAVHQIITGLDENIFFKRYGVTLEKHCGDGLRFLKSFGLVEYTNGVWRYTGEWEFRRVRDFYALIRILFGEELLARLRVRFRHHYKPEVDYSVGAALLNDYANNPLSGLFYSKIALEANV